MSEFSNIKITSNENLNSQETFGLTAEELKIAEEIWENLDQNMLILLISTIIYKDYEPKKYLVKHLKTWKKRLLQDLSEEDIRIAFENFEESIFVETKTINNNKIYKPRDKYRDFIKNKKQNYLAKIT